MDEDKLTLEREVQELKARLKSGEEASKDEASQKLKVGHGQKAGPCPREGEEGGCYSSGTSTEDPSG